MSKAVLVLDEMPKSCVKCRLSIYNGEVCCTAVHKHAKPIDDIRTKPDWCPLKVAPEKMDICGTYNAEYRAKGGWMPSVKIGWNKCVNYLLGEEEK